MSCKMRSVLVVVHSIVYRPFLAVASFASRLVLDYLWIAYRSSRVWQPAVVWIVEFLSIERDSLEEVVAGVAMMMMMMLLLLQCRW